MQGVIDHMKFIGIIGCAAPFYHIMQAVKNEPVQLGHIFNGPDLGRFKSGEVT